MAGPRPNILVCGTPGTGKTTLCKHLAAATGLAHVNIGELCASRELYDGFDVELDCHVIDEDKIVDELDDEDGINIMKGGYVVDYHGCDFFPERFFQLVVVLRTDNTVLWNRLEQRGYSFEKVQENVEAEIMQVLVEEARESYELELVQELPSNTSEDMDSNLDRLCAWLQAHEHGAS